MDDADDYYGIDGVGAGGRLVSHGNTVAVLYRDYVALVFKTPSAAGYALAVHRDQGGLGGTLVTFENEEDYRAPEIRFYLR